MDAVTKLTTNIIDTSEWKFTEEKTPRIKCKDHPDPNTWLLKRIEEGHIQRYCIKCERLIEEYSRCGRNNCEERAWDLQGQGDWGFCDGFCEEHWVQQSEGCDKHDFPGLLPAAWVYSISEDIITTGMETIRKVCDKHGIWWDYPADDGECEECEDERLDEIRKTTPCGDCKHCIMLCDDPCCNLGEGYMIDRPARERCEKYEVRE